jgi:CRP/FNR family transcriptional regulator, cyclic AMP receptor protein
MTGTRELLAGHPFLAGLEPAWLDRLSSFAHPVYRGQGYRLFAQGRPATRFWLLRSGRVTLDIDTDINTPGRGVVAIETVEPGTVVGWSWLFPPYRWHFGAVALDPIRTIEFEAAGVRHLMADDPALGHALTRQFMNVVVDRLQAARSRLLDLYAYPDAPPS